MSPSPPPWSVPASLAELHRGPLTFDLAPDAAVRAAIGRLLKLEALPDLTAQVRLTPWMDGVEVQGRWRAVVAQVCGLSLETFQTPLAGEFRVRCVPVGSPHAQSPEDEVEIDLEADDPPDLLEGDHIDVAAYVVEYLALEIDPFPRKPGAVFEPPATETPPSPFAVLSKLKTPPES